MPDWFTDFLCGVSLNIATGIWNLCMSKVTMILGSTPQEFSTGTWDFVSNTVYPWALSIGISMLNLFFIIAMWQAVKNLHQNITIEMCIEAMIKIVVANVVLVNLKDLITKIFSAASAMTKEVFTMETPSLKVDDIDIGSVLFYQLFGILFILVAIVCGFMILLTVYSRYIKLYVLVVLAPFAVPTLIGGHGVERTFFSWMKTFLLNVFDVVVIALVMVISWKLGKAGISLNESQCAAINLIDGMGDAINCLFTMVLMTAAVKSSNSLLSKAFGL